MDLSNIDNSKIVIVVARDLQNRRVLTSALEREGCAVVELASAGDVMHWLKPSTMAVFVDVSSDLDGGGATIRRVSGIDREVPVIAVTTNRDAETALAALRAGAYDCITASLEQELLAAVANRAIEHRSLVLRVAKLAGSYHALEEAVNNAMAGRNADLEQRFGEGTDVHQVPSGDNAVARNEVVPLRVLEERAIKHALQATNGSVTKAARLLGIGRATLYRRLANNSDRN